VNDHDIDALIAETLSREEAEFFARLDEPPVFAQLAGVFRARNRWLNVLGMTLTLVFLGLAVYSVTRFLSSAAEVRDMLRWGAALFFSVQAVWALKIWYWMELQRNNLTREIKRLELQVALLAEELRAKRADLG
jgi:hypothetical protein